MCKPSLVQKDLILVGVFLEREKHIWVVVSNIFYFHTYLGKISNLTNMFQTGWNHQPDILEQKSPSIQQKIFNTVCFPFFFKYLFAFVKSQNILVLAKIVANQWVIIWRIQRFQDSKIRWFKPWPNFIPKRWVGHDSNLW